jgi:alpha-D-xyloside xylohydrolase
VSTTGPGAYERATPVFDRRRRAFHPILALAGVRVSGGGTAVELDLATRDGLTLQGRITFAALDVVRVQWAYGGMPGAHASEMLVGEPPALPLTVDEQDDRVVIDAGGPPVVLERKPWRLTFGPYATENHDTSLTEWVAEPGGYAIDTTTNQTLVYETFALGPNEELYGLGERFHGPALRGHRLSHWIDEPFGTNTADRVYKSVPLVLSSRGYGLYFNHPEEAVFDLGAGSNASATVLVHAGEMDHFILLGDPKQMLERYTALTGRPSVPPEWTFGVWLSRCMYASRAEVEEIVETARSHDLPVDVIGVDPLWLAHRPGADFDTCDFVWNEKDFGPLAEFVNWLHERDVRLCLWVNTHVRAGSEAWRPERLVDGGRARDPLFPERGWVDLTGAGADWWLEEMTRLVEAGVDGFKLDYSETLPSDARMADGRSGAEVHNLYPLLAAMVADRAGAPIHFTRAGTAGSQRYPLHWAGDSQSSWAGFRGALRGGLAAAWSGFAHWTSDIGGFYHRDLHNPEDETWGFRQADPELFIRWMQFGMLCSHTRFHGTQPREPWHFGEQAVEVARAFSAMRLRLRPYLLDCAEEAARTGCPVLRPVALEFPHDLGARHIDTEYLLGPGLLVCPVLQPGGSVDVYLPPGRWTDHFTGKSFDGPGWVRFDDVPLDRLPLFVRDGFSPFA